jgi:hypothetical protein
MYTTQTAGNVDWSDFSLDKMKEAIKLIGEGYKPPPFDTIRAGEFFREIIDKIPKVSLPVVHLPLNGVNVIIKEELVNILQLGKFIRNEDGTRTEEFQVHKTYDYINGRLIERTWRSFNTLGGRS